MSPITQRATLKRVLEYHAQQLQIQLSRLEQGLKLAGNDAERFSEDIRTDLVDCIRLVHVRIGTLYSMESDGVADMYFDNRGLHP